MLRSVGSSRGMNQAGETVANMRRDIEWCRKCAESCSDEKIAASLSRMADDLEADLKRLEGLAVGRCRKTTDIR